MGHQLLVGGDWILILLVIAGALPEVAASWQFLLIAGHFRRHHYQACEPVFPRTAILIPAWNEAAVIGASIDRLMALQYPPASLRVYLVDDASTDETPAVAAGKAAQYPGRVFHLRREVGGQGKAHTLNHGLAIILEDDWMEALLITDADVIFIPDSLRKMTRHLADPQVGAVTAYIKEGSRPGNYMTRFIGYEYATAQAAARRAQNVLGAMACLAGGAQLHTRENLIALGGRIDTSSLAEDTISTFETQLRGRRVVFEPHAVVWAEEPGSIVALWKQRLRWARGNVQVTRRYRRVWFRPRGFRHPRVHRLGSASFGLFWFCLFLQPVFLITSSAALITLYYAHFPRAWLAFHVLWIINAATYVFITCFTLMIDPQTARHSWRQGVMFPGAVNLVFIVYSCFPRLFRDAAHAEHIHLGWGIVIAYAWLSLSMVTAYLAKVLEPGRFGRILSPLLVYVVGYGSLLCACTFASYLKELQRAEMTWDKTEKTGKVVVPG
ncbi:MAG TPA: glycosyltransferase [Streptosporangiaceae bacterium]|jgi:cellulose synthase/poly-beta-1,6-N-acetylglucosamine synthase-like glycosyltransferase